MISIRRQSAASRVAVPVLLALLCFTLTVQGGHVCPLAQQGGPGLHSEVGRAAPLCTLCALAHSLMVAIALLLLQLIPGHFWADSDPVQTRSFGHGLRLHVRPPPVLL